MQTVSYRHALATVELLMIRHGLLTVEHNAFNTINERSK